MESERHTERQDTKKKHRPRRRSGGRRRRAERAPIRGASAPPGPHGRLYETLPPARRWPPARRGRRGRRARRRPARLRGSVAGKITVINKGQRRDALQGRSKAEPPRFGRRSKKMLRVEDALRGRGRRRETSPASFTCSGRARSHRLCVGGVLQYAIDAAFDARERYITQGPTTRR